MQNDSQTFFDLEADDIDGNFFSFSNLKGKKAFLIVNVACQCGLTTDHYKQLVEMYKLYQPKGLEILGFPCNQFGAEEPQPEPEIKQYVSQKFGVTFPLFSKIEVNGPRTHNVYKFLKTNGGMFDKSKGTFADIAWNFGKFLVDGNGQVVEYFSPEQSPNSMKTHIEQLLK